MEILFTGTFLRMENDENTEFSVSQNDKDTHTEKKNWTKELVFTVI